MQRDSWIALGRPCAHKLPLARRFEGAPLVCCDVLADVFAAPQCVLRRAQADARPIALLAELGHLMLQDVALVRLVRKQSDHNLCACVLALFRAKPHDMGLRHTSSAGGDLVWAEGADYDNSR